MACACLPALDQLKHIVVLMMENRSFDHMLGALRATDPRIDGFPDDWTNPGPNGKRSASLKATIADSSHRIPSIISRNVDQRSSTGTRAPAAWPR
jgi:phospholipase C